MVKFISKSELDSLKTDNKKSHNAGEILTVKYDPKDPAQSTDNLEPHISTIIVNGIGGLFFIGVGVFVVFTDKIRHSSG